MRPWQRDERKILGTEKKPGKHRGCARSEQSTAGKSRSFGKPCGAGRMKDRDCRRGIDGGGRKRRAAIANAHKPIHRLRFPVILNPGANIQGAAVHDVAIIDRLVNDQNLCAAIGKNTPHLGERELRIQRNGNSASADDGQEPVEAVAIVGAINGNRLARLQADGTAQEGIDPANCRVQLRKMERAGLADRNHGISLPSQQFVHQVGDRDATVSRELNAAEEIHSAGTSLRPQSLATQ